MAKSGRKSANPRKKAGAKKAAVDGEEKADEEHTATDASAKEWLTLSNQVQATVGAATSVAGSKLPNVNPKKASVQRPQLGRRCKATNAEAAADANDGNLATSSTAIPGNGVVGTVHELEEGKEQAHFAEEGVVTDEQLDGADMKPEAVLNVDKTKLAAAVEVDDTVVIISTEISAHFAEHGEAKANEQLEDGDKKPQASDVENTKLEAAVGAHDAGGPAIAPASAVNGIGVVDTIVAQSDSGVAPPEKSESQPPPPAAAVFTDGETSDQRLADVLAVVLSAIDQNASISNILSSFEQQLDDIQDGIAQLARRGEQS